MPKSKIQSGGKHRGKTHSYAGGGKVSDIPAFAKGGSKLRENVPFVPRDHMVEAGFSEEFVSAQERMRQPGDPTDKGPEHKQRIVSINKEDRKYSLSSARKAGHLYYWKKTGKTVDGKPKYTKMAAVTRKDLKESGYAKLRDYMNRQLGKERRIKPRRTKEEHMKTGIHRPLQLSKQELMRQYKLVK